jgi:hypothetical protein
MLLVHVTLTRQRLQFKGESARETVLYLLFIYQATFCWNVCRQRLGDILENTHIFILLYVNFVRENSIMKFPNEKPWLEISASINCGKRELIRYFTRLLKKKLTPYLL